MNVTIKEVRRDAAGEVVGTVEHTVADAVDPDLLRGGDDAAMAAVLANYVAVTNRRRRQRTEQHNAWVTRMEREVEASAKTMARAGRVDDARDLIERAQAELLARKAEVDEANDRDALAIRAARHGLDGYRLTWDVDRYGRVTGWQATPTS